MERAELLDALLELARNLGIAVRRQTLRAAAVDERLPTTGLCRINGEPILLVMDHEPIEDRIATVALALRQTAGDALEDRYLPPRIRETLEAAPPFA